MFHLSSPIGPVATRHRPSTERPFNPWPFAAGPRPVRPPRRFVPCPDAAALIADVGHPRWPGWQLIFAAMLAVQVWLAASPAEHPFTRHHRPAPVRAIVKIVRSGGRGDGGRP